MEYGMTETEAAVKTDEITRSMFAKDSTMHCHCVDTLLFYQTPAGKLIKNRRDSVEKANARAFQKRVKEVDAKIKGGVNKKTARSTTAESPPDEIEAKRKQIYEEWLKTDRKIPYDDYYSSKQN